MQVRHKFITLTKRQCDRCNREVAKFGCEVKYAYEYYCASCYEENVDSSDRCSEDEYEQ